MTSKNQEFKKFEKMFSAREIAECRKRWLYNGSIAEDRNNNIKWVREVSSWAQDFVQFCVYHASDHLEWQLFRVSLKGLTTSEKLYMLDNRFDSLVQSIASNNPTGEVWVEYKLQKCRIDNYILALVRGGQLSSTFEIQK